ncbi:uncharacterized protein LOC130712413 [Lotus japonicus]|uniref:uncharacterized protein LOC130712413 n=1 Tax=Lotus japonicus TaxID=34305 RepID=UPI00258DACBE|nr:uncharacterized protein LOC130712413 [Lotus japonicus]
MGYANFKELIVNDVMRYHFSDHEVGFLFYTWYSRMHGFAAQKCRVLKEGDVIQQSFVCFREGTRRDSFGNGRKQKHFPRKNTRCGCPDHFQVHVDKGNKRWHVRSMLNVHN